MEKKGPKRNFSDDRPKIILAAIDFSTESRRALKHAFGLAADFSRVILLHVIPPATDHMADAARPLANARQKLKEFCRMSDAAIAPKSTHFEVRSGTPFREIVECAKENAVEMIVLGVDDSAALGGVALGHTADRVSRYAPCPVLLIRKTTTGLTSSKDQLKSKA